MTEEVLEALRAQWVFFDEIHRWASSKDNIHPPLLISSSNGTVRSRNVAPSTNTLDLSSSSNLSQTDTSTSSSSRDIPVQILPTRGKRKKCVQERALKHIKKEGKSLRNTLNSLCGVLGAYIQNQCPEVDVSSLLQAPDDSDTSSSE